MPDTRHVITLSPRGYDLMILDDNVGQQMNAIFIADLNHAEEITLLRFCQRPWVERLMERAARLIQRLL